MIETRYHLNPDRFNTLQKLVLTEKEDKVTASENSTTSLMWFKRYGDNMVGRWVGDGWCAGGASGGWGSLRQSFHLRPHGIPRPGPDRFAY